MVEQQNRRQAIVTIQSLRHWFMAIRPKTLPAAAAPVFIASVMAFGDGVEHVPSAILCLCAALAIQIGTNLANDYYDFRSGADTAERTGPTRVTQAGLISPEIMRAAFVAVFILAALFSYWLVRRGGWPIAIIGIAAIASGIFYTAGPRPLGYIGLGDFFVFIFFGPVAVAGTYYVQSYELNLAVIFAGFAPGFISAAILCVNNLRDIHSDRKAGKRTLAVRFGREFTISQYLVLIIAAALMPVAIYALIRDHIAILTSTAIMFLAVPTIRTVISSTDGPPLNRSLGQTGLLLIIYSILFSIGWVA